MPGGGPPALLVALLVACAVATRRQPKNPRSSRPRQHHSWTVLARRLTWPPVPFLPGSRPSAQLAMVTGSGSDIGGSLGG